MQAWSGRAGSAIDTDSLCKDIARVLQRHGFPEVHVDLGATSKAPRQQVSLDLKSLVARALKGSVTRAALVMAGFLLLYVSWTYQLETPV